MLLVLILLILFSLEIHNFIKLREQVSNKNFNGQLKTLESKYVIIEKYYNNLDKEHEIYNKLDYCIKENSIQEIIDYFKRNEKINHQNIKAFRERSTQCVFYTFDDVYQKYDLENVYENNPIKSISFFKEDLFFNLDIEDIVTVKLDDLITELSNFIESIELIVGDKYE